MVYTANLTDLRNVELDVDIIPVPQQDVGCERVGNFWESGVWISAGTLRRT